MTLSKSKKQNYLELLPRGFVKKIYEESGKVVSYRQLQRILSGESEDSHGLIDLAIKKIKAHQRKMQRNKEATLALTLTSSTLKTK